MRLYKHGKFNNNQGVISIITLLAVSTLALAIVTTISTVAIDEIQMVNAGSVIDRTFYAAEAGLNEGLYRLGEGVAVPVTYNFNIDGVDVAVTLSGSGHDRTVRSEATDSGGRKRVLEINATASSFAGGFASAIHGGANGIFLANNSTINGDVHSNGNIQGNGGDSSRPFIDGNVTVSGQNFVDKIRVSGNLEAYQVTKSEIFQELIFGGTVDNDTDVNSSACGNPVSNPNCSYVVGRELPDQPMPLTPTDVDALQAVVTAAIAAGEAVDIYPDPAKCPASVPNPTEVYCIDSIEEALGMGKINGDLYVDNDSVVILDGEIIWVTGDIMLENNGTIEVNPTNPDLAEKMVAVIADGIIDISNNYTVIPYIDPVTSIVDDKSFILLVSTSNSFDTAAPAVWASNNSNAIVFAAVNGMLKVKQNGKLVAGAAHELYLENNAKVNYNPNLSSFVIGSGGGEEIGTAFGSWREL